MTIKQKINIEREVKFKINPTWTKLELERFLKKLNLIKKEQISQKDIYWDNQICEIINLKRGLRVRYISDQIKDVEFKSLFKGESGQYVIEEIKLFKKGCLDTSSLKEILVNRLEICKAKDFNNDDSDSPELFLSRLGLMPVVTLEKKRSVWIDNKREVEVSVDAVSGLGIFVEVEQIGRIGQVFDFIVKELENSGFAVRDITHSGYLDLILIKNNRITSKSEFEKRFMEDNMWNVKTGEKNIFLSLTQ